MTNEEFIQSITLPGEEWELAHGCGGRYAVSTFGRLAALSFPYYQGKYLCYRQQRIKKQKLNTHGYYMANVIYEGRSRLYSVHRIVAETFLPNPDNLPCVNHKDENKKNNRVDNLEWCTHKYNINYGEQYKIRSVHALKPLTERNPVAQLSKSGEIIKIHRSVYYAVKATGICRASIRRCLKGKRNTAGGYMWQYASDYEPQVSMSKNS